MSMTNAESGAGKMDDEYAGTQLGRTTAALSQWGTPVAPWYDACLSGLHTHPPVLVFFYEQGINPLAIGADVLDAIV